MDAKQRQHLQQHGWVVIPNVVRSELCDAARQDMENLLITSPQKPKLDEPWDWLKKLPYGTPHGGMNRSHAHFQSLWDIRMEESLVQCFSSYYHMLPTEMVTSMDGWSYYLAGAMTQEMRNKKWFHFDQGAEALPVLPKTNQIYECLQGYVNLLDSDDKEDGNLFVLDGSHLLHKAYFSKHPQKRMNNFVPLDANWIQDLDRDPIHYPPVVVYSKKGDVVLWYSTLAHQGLPPSSKGRTRCVLYISQAPKCLLTDKKDMAIRKQAWNEQRMTAHWAACHVRLSPYMYPNIDKKSKPKLTKLGQSLLGF